MDKKKSPNFTLGFLIGLLLCIVLWYWQKSTAAEDGALDLLDRQAEIARRLRQAEAKVAAAANALDTQSPPKEETQPEETQPKESTFDLQQVKGIGPKFDTQLQEVGVTTLTQLLALGADKLADILEIGPNRAANILTDAKTFS